MIHATIRPLSLALAAFAIAPLTAQGGTRNFSATRTSNYGISLAGGSTTLRANAAVTTPSTLFGTTSLAAGLSNTANVRLFGQTREAAAMVADFRSSHTPVGITTGGIVFQNTATGSFAVRLAGMTVVSATSTSNTQSNNLAADVFPSTGVGYSVSLLGMSVGVTGNVTARAAYTLTPTISFANGLVVDLNGPVRASAVGRTGASVSVLGASAGTQATLVFANTNGTAALHVTPATATGTVNYTVQPVQLALSVFASLSLPLVPTLTASQTVFSYSMPSQSGTLNLTQN